MLATFKETISSLQDKSYGQTIIQKTPRQALWYWTKYLILISLIPFTLTIVFFTRFLPQAPRIVRDNFPEGNLTLADNQLTSTIQQPLRFEDQGFIFLFDLQATSSAIDSINSGLVITQDKMFIKNIDGQQQSQDYSFLPDFSLDKFQIADWIQSHRYQLWVISLFVVFIVGLIFFSLTWILRVAAFLFWSLIFWLVSKYLIHKTITFSQTLNFVAYGSVLPLILSPFAIIAPNNLLSYINFGIFVYFTYSWIKHLPKKNKS